MARIEYDNVVKIVVVGDMNVGKSSLIIRYTWDTAGQERFRTLIKGYYRDAHGIIVVYDISNKGYLLQESYDNVKLWIEELKHRAPKDVNVLLVGNKSDLSDKREVSKSDAQAYCKTLSIPFVETSAKNSSNVELAILTMISEIKNRITAKEKNGKIKSVNLNSEKRRSCCVLS